MWCEGVDWVNGYKFILDDAASPGADVIIRLTENLEEKNKKFKNPVGSIFERNWTGLVLQSDVAFKLHDTYDFPLDAFEILF